MKDELISIIVPVYQVEKYLDRCIQSIVTQTYPYLEIILVDDGSPDRCGSMCDAWAEKDTRIHVIHQDNAGLSAARNAGLDHASGNWISFVDSDDYISVDMLEKLYCAAVENNADISICNFLCVDEDGTPNNYLLRRRLLQDVLLTGREAIKELFEPNNVSYVVSWNKLYKKSLFDTIRFPVGKRHEDEYVIHYLYAVSDRVVCIPDICYYYVRRNGSLTNEVSVASIVDAKGAILDRLRLTDSIGEHELAARGYYKEFLDLADLCTEKNWKEDKDLIWKRYEEFRKLIYLRKYTSIRKQLHLLLTYVSPYLHCMMICLRRWSIPSYGENKQDGRDTV